MSPIAKTKILCFKDIFILKVLILTKQLKKATIIHKIFEINSSFYVKYHTAGKV